MAEERTAVYPDTQESSTSAGSLSRRRVLAGGATTGVVATAGCLGAGSEPVERPTVFVFNTGDGTVSLIDPESDTLLETRSIGLSSSFPSNQYTPGLTDSPED